MIRALICDMDGVLIDSSDVHEDAWRKLFAPYGVTFDHGDYVAKGAGRSRDAVIRAVLGDRPEHDQLMERKADLARVALARDGVSTIPGAAELVARARAAGLPVAVGSSSRMATEFLRGAGLFDLFDFVVDRNDTERGKPAPDIFLEVVRRLGVPAAECLVIEDTPAGIEAAKAAGCQVVGITTGSTRVALSKADWVVDGLAEVGFG
ncbi:MAG: beta-phosphoglucomutase [Kiritimatiellia bacterium]|jgi:beta-phosphoglucomutase